MNTRTTVAVKTRPGGAACERGQAAARVVAFTVDEEVGVTRRLRCYSKGLVLDGQNVRPGLPHDKRAIDDGRQKTGGKEWGGNQGAETLSSTVKSRRMSTILMPEAVRMVRHGRRLKAAVDCLF